MLPKGMNVLIVEDDAPMALLIGATLRSLASKIEVAPTFRAAKEWLEKLKFNLVLVDLALPDSDAVETLSRISELKSPGTKVVILTGAWPPSFRLMPHETGADALIYKGDVDMNDRLRQCLASSAPVVSPGV